MGGTGKGSNASASQEASASLARTMTVALPKYSSDLLAQLSTNHKPGRCPLGHLADGMGKNPGCYLRSAISYLISQTPAMFPGGECSG